MNSKVCLLLLLLLLLASFTGTPALADDGWTQAFAFPLTSNTGDAGRGYAYVDPTDNKTYVYYGADTASGGQVWRSSDGVSWNQVNANGFGTIGPNPIAKAFSWFSSYSVGGNNFLYAGAAKNAAIAGDGAQIYRSLGGSSTSQWTLVFSSQTTGNANDNDPGGGNAVTFNGALYIGTRNNVNGGEVWKSVTADAPGNWIQVSTNGFGEGAAANANIAYLKVFGSNLYAATNCRTTGPPCGQIWKTTGTVKPPDINTWTQVLVASNTFDTTGQTFSVSALESFNGMLYATTLSTGNHAQMFRSATPDVGPWTQVFSPDSGCANCFALATSTEIHTLRLVGNLLFASTWDSNGGLVVYRSADGTTWTRSNTAGGFGSAANQYVGDFVSLNGKIFSDTFNTAGGALWTSGFTAPVVTTLGSSGGVLQLAPAPGPVTVTIPAGAFPPGTNVTLTAPSSFPSPASSAGNLAGTGVGLQIDVSPALQPAAKAVVSIAYRASDVAGLNPARLILARFDPGDGTWVPLPSSPVPASNYVAALVDHFSLFQLMQSGPGASVSAAKAFPNPMRAFLGQTSMTFILLPANARVRIYTANGILVRDLVADANGMTLWDGTNQNGGPVASGVYFAYAQSGSQSRTFKVAIER